MANIVNNYSSTIVTIFQDVIRTYENNIETIKQAEGELTDLEHEIELSNPKNARDGYKIYKELREIRIKRRTAKDENQLLQDMYDYFKSQQGQSFKSKLQQIQVAAAKIENAQSCRTYTPRQRNDLSITDKTCETIKPFEEMLKEFNQTKVSMQGGKLRK